MQEFRKLILGVLTMCALIATVPAAASADRGFTARFSTNDTGDIAGIANTLMTCPAGSNSGGNPSVGCAATQSVTASTTSNQSYNNNYDMTYVDVDSDNSTFNSSTASQSLPSGAQILFAGLYWGGDWSTGSTASPDANARNTVKLKLPGSGSYQTLTADTLDDSTLNVGRYQAFKDVTTLIKALPNAGNGSYAVANVQAGKGSDHYAGWTLIVAYRDTAQPARNLTVFDGLKTIRVSDPPTAIPVSGFLTPPAGAVKTEVGFVTWEGDHGLVGDSASLNGTVLSDAQHPATNFFNSRISRDGVMFTDRNPSYANALGFDSAFTNADGILGNNATSATITVTTSGDQYLPGVITFATEIYAPKIVQTKTVVDDNGGDVISGDTLTYTITGVNNGQDGTSGFVLRDPIPANTTYIPGSIKLVQNDGSTTGSVTDAGGDDRGEYDSANSRIVARLGAGSSATAGGNIAPGKGYKVTFQVKVNPLVPTDGAIDNTATASFLSQTTGTPLTAVSASPTKSVKAPDLRIVKTLTGANPVAGSTTTYRLAVDNVGVAPTVGTVTVSDPLPAGVTATAVSATGWTCNALPATSLTCTRSDSLAGGAAYPAITLTVAIGPDYDGNVVNTATVSGGGDANLTNNSSSVTSPSTRSADLELKKTASKATVNIGEAFDFTLKVTNNGPSTATSVAISDPLPDGFTYVASDGACTIDPPSGVIVCPVGTLAPGASKTVTLHVKADADAGGRSIKNIATTGGAQTDPAPGNNSDSATVAVAGVDLAVTKQLLAPAAPKTGDTVTYAVSVKNNGPSAATAVVLHDALPAGLSGVTTDTPSCAVTTGAVDCPVGNLAVGATYTVQVSGTVKANTTVLVNRASAQGGEPDPDLTNNTAEVTTPVATVADLSITKTADKGVVSEGDTIVYTFLIKNDGSGEAAGITVSDTLPAGLTYVGGAPGCSATGQVVACSVNPIAAGGQRQTGISVKVDAGAHGSVTNTAKVQATTPDPDISNNTSSVTTPVAEVADIAIVKTVDDAHPHTGDVVTYTLKVTNAGPATAGNVVVTDALPTGVTFVSADAPCAEDHGTVTCDLGSIAGGDSRSVQVKAKVDAIAVGDPSATHDIDVQKVEAQIDLDPGQSRTISVDCPTGYIVTDGSVRTDAVDQGTGTLASTQVNESRTTALGTWTGSVRNDAAGRAQAKIFAVCVKAQTSEANGHSHSLIVSDPVTVHQTLLAGANTVQLPCGPGTVAIAPGHTFAGDADLLASQESGDGWKFVVDVAENIDATFSVRCLSKTVSSVNGHTHELHLERLTQRVVVPAHQVVEVQLTCSDNAKGIVAGWDLAPGLISLGNDPRPKTRAFKLMNPTDGDLAANLSLLCLDGRTGGEAGAAHIVNAAQVSTTTQESDTSDNGSWAALDALSADVTAPPATGGTTSTGGGSATTPTTVPSVTPTNTVQSQVGTARSALRALSAVTVKNGTATVTITGPVTTKGTATLVATKTIKVGKKVIKKGTVLASGRFSVKAGKTAKVKLKATRAGLKALKAKALRSATLKLGSAASTVVLKGRSLPL